MNKAIKLLLFQSGHSIYSLRRITGTSQVTVWELLSGVRKKPNPHYIEKIAHALGIAPKELLQLTCLSDNEITPEILYKVTLSFANSQAHRDEEKIESSPPNYSYLLITQNGRVCKWKPQKRN